jgi:hypothetical protein
MENADGMNRPDRQDDPVVTQPPNSTLGMDILRRCQDVSILGPDRLVPSFGARP